MRKLGEHLDCVHLKLVERTLSNGTVPSKQKHVYHSDIVIALFR